uniref:Activating signal cointegrator 1 complex subunit 3 n=1 Tax=Fagus sylvatica TaxID=28930 RepID=A0A2N9HEA5_FAGSY
MTLCRFKRGQNDDLKKELVREVTTLDHAYALAQNYETVIKSQLVKQPDTRCSSNPLSLGSKPSVVPPQSKLYYSNVSVSKDENGKRMASEPLILNSQVASNDTTKMSENSLDTPKVNEVGCRLVQPKEVELGRKFEDLELFGNDKHPQLDLLKAGNLHASFPLREVVKSRNKDLVELFEYGIGVHHAGMLRADRGLTERLFSDGLLKVLVCTATLAWGVNLPAHTVVIKPDCRIHTYEYGTQLYDPKAGGWRDLGMLDVMQIFGRAGRPQFDKSGEGIIITSHEKLAYYLRLLTSQLPIESQVVTLPMTYLVMPLGLPDRATMVWNVVFERLGRLSNGFVVFNSNLAGELIKLPLDYLIHNSSGLGRISEVYHECGSEGLYLCEFISSLKDNLNAEVALGTVTNVKEACAWLGYTYLFIRMRMNPLAYGIGWDEVFGSILAGAGTASLDLSVLRVFQDWEIDTLTAFLRLLYSVNIRRDMEDNTFWRPTRNRIFEVIADPSLSSKQRALVTDAARALDKAKMMRFDEKSGNFYCTELGRIASHFYIQYSSVETYNEMLRRHMNDSEVIDMVAHSSEFENIAFREEEQNELEMLARSSCPLEVKGGPSNKHGKISILIQLYISRGSIDSFSLVSDAAYISASLARIMRALFEICLRRGWCEISLLMLEYCKAVDRQIWPHQHPLRQFGKDISAEITRKLEERGADLDRLHEMQEKDIGALIRYAHGGKVDLLITPDFIWKDRFHGVAERWWILVEDSENDHIYHSELFTLTKRMARGEPLKLSFTVPIFEPHPPQYYIRAVSDSWLHSESFYTISFQNLALPEGRTSHTELLDLKPLPVTSLGNSSYEALYKFSHFNPIQTQTFHVLYHTDNNVLLGAPTGSGKTISAELAMLHLFNTQPDMKVIYIAPLKAIVRERMNDWKKRLVSQLGKEMVEMTGDYTPDMMALMSADIIISTPEKWDGISRNWHSRSYVTKVGLMILDEIHLLGADRGPILEVIVSRMRYISSQTERAVRFVGLSTALANAGDLADWLGVGEIGLFNFKPSVRPVPLEVHIQGYPGKFYCPRMNSMNKPAYAAICTHSPTKPVLIFVSSRRQTRLTALDLIQFAASDEHSRQFLNMPEEALQMVLSQVTDQNLRHTLQFGIGLHHAGLNEKDRSLVLVCTSTLAWGVNLPAHLVIIKGTEYYDGKAKRYVDFPITDILQMMGRAGRPQFDQHGKAVILVHEPKKSFYKKFLYEPFPVESSLREQLHDHINAEIISSTICHKEDAVHYLTWTYLFRRLSVNPAYYGLEGTDSEMLSSYLSRLVQNTFEDLEDSGCIKMSDDSVEPMMLGSIASQYYLSYMTVSMFGSNIGPDTSLEVFLHILSAASEYNELPVRHNEENYNEALSERVRYMVDKNRLDDPHVKANLLFQGLWFDKDSSLWMLPSMNVDLASSLNKRGISTLQQLLDLPKATFQTVIGNFPAPRLYQDLQHFPCVQVRLKLQRRDTDGAKSPTLNIRLEKINFKRNKSRAFTPRFPKVKDEAWWLILGNTSTSDLYALKRVSFSDRLVTHMELPSTHASLQVIIGQYSNQLGLAWESPPKSQTQIKY